jgi:hypothetical protein
MSCRSKLAARSRLGLLTIVMGAGSLLSPLPALADSPNVSLKNFSTMSKDGSKIFIASADFANTNLTQDEIAKLLSPATPDSDELALVTKLNAEKISIPTIELTPEEGGKITLRDFTADGVEAGKAAKIMIAGIDGAGVEGGEPVTIKSGALRMEAADLVGLLNAVGGKGETTPARVGRLVWESVDIVAPDTESGPGKTIHLAFGSFEFTSDFEGQTLTKGATVLKGLIVEPSPGSEFADSLGALGYSRLEIGAAFGLRYQVSDKALSIDDLTIEGAQMGVVGVKARLGDVDPVLVSGGDRIGRTRAVLGCTIAGLEVKIVNAGLFEKALAFYAKQQGTTPDALRQEISAAAVEMVPLMMGGDPSSLTLAAEAKKFIDDPKNLTVSIKAKGAPLKTADFMRDDLSELLAKVDISATANQ